MNKRATLGPVRGGGYDDGEYIWMSKEDRDKHYDENMSELKWMREPPDAVRAFLARVIKYVAAQDMTEAEREGPPVQEHVEAALVMWNEMLEQDDGVAAWAREHLDDWLDRWASTMPGLSSGG